MGPANSREEQGDPEAGGEEEEEDQGLAIAVPASEHRNSTSGPPPPDDNLTESECSCSERAEETARLTAAGVVDGGGGGDECSPPDEDVLSYCEYHDLPPPPDGGYGWVIVIASFMCNMIVDGIAYTFGVFLGEFVKFFGEGKGKTAWVGSLLSGMYLSAGPVVSALTNKFGCRTVCIAGSIIGCAAFVLSIFSPNVNVLMLTYGVMGGIGFGLIYLPAVVCVGYYFETKRSLATGIAVCGSGFGTFAFAPLATMLLDHFDWRGANLILAGLILNCAVFGAMMRPLEFPSSTPSCKPLLQRMAEEKRFQMERGSIGGSYFMVQLPDGSMEKRLKMPINIDPGVHSSFNLDQLVPGTPLTPVPTVPTLPTISEVKVPDHSGSSGASSQGSAADLKEKEKNNRNASTPPRIIEDVVQEEMAAATTVELRNRKNSDVTPVGDMSSAARAMPRNASQPAFTTHVQGLPKNGSVPFFDRVRKTSAGERYRPTLGAIKVSRGNINSNGDIRKSLHLRLSNSSFLGGSRNNNSEEMWSKTDMADNESIYFTTSKSSIPREQRREMVRPLSRKDIFYSGSVMNLPEFKSQKSLASYRQSVISLPKYAQERGDGPDLEKGTDLCPCLTLPESFKSTLASMMDMTLLKDPVFMLISISNFFGMMGLYVPFVYLVDAAQLNGIDPNSASFLLSIIGITNTVGRVVCGFVADFPWMDALLLNNICLVVSTVAVAATPLCTSYAGYITMAIFFGIAISGYISLTSIILVDLLGLDKLTNAFGLLILFRGGAAILGSPLAGAVYDATLSYDIPFYMAAAFFGVSAATSFAAPLLKNCQPPAEVPPLPEDDALTPIDEDVEEENYEDDELAPRPVPEIVETAASPINPPSQEIKQIESVL